MASGNYFYLTAATILTTLSFLLSFSIAHRVAAQGIHSPAWDPILSSQSILATSTNSTRWTTGRTAAFSALANGDNPFFIDYLPIQSSDIAAGVDSNKIVSVKFADAGICLAFKIGDEFSFSLTPVALAYLLSGNYSYLPAALTVGSLSVAPSDISLVIPSSTASSLVETVATAVSNLNIGFTIASVLSNPKVSLVATEEAALTAVTASNRSITLASKVSAVKASLPCIQLEVSHETYTTVTVSVGPDTVVAPNAVAAYPLLQGAYIFLSIPYACATGANSEANVAFKQLEVLVRSAVTTSLSLWGVKAVDFSSQLTLLTNTFTSNDLCGEALVIPSGGSSAILPLAEAWSIRYLGNFPETLTLLDYPGGGSGAGLRGIKSKAFQIAGSDSLFSDDEYDDFPDVQFVPATSFAVSVIVNVPGASALVLPRCVVVGIFTGQILYWDHPDITIHNPSVLLPHAIINVFARSTRSGTTGIFLGGMASLNDACAAAGSTLLTQNVPVNKTSTWNLFFPTLGLRTSTGKVVSAVQATPYSIGYGSSGAARAAELVEAALIDDQSQAVAGPTVASVSSAMELATINSQRLTFQFEISPTAYPFVGITYFVYHRSQTGNCTRFRKALDLVIWSGTTNEGKQLAEDLSYVPLPEAVFSKVLEKIYQESTCDGNLLYPEQQISNVAAKETNVVAVSVGTLAAVLCLAIIVVAIIAYLMKANTGRDNDYAPKDESQDISIVFTDIESSTSLWARGPTAMGPALDIHNEVLRQAIAKNKCYEVKTIGDAFMVACNTPEQALQFTYDAQMGLLEADWQGHAEEINSLYEELHAEAGNTTGKEHWALPTGSAAGSKQIRIWNGLRVRMGIATGKPSIRLDEVTGGYDYFGQTSNLASRVEAASHGGQVMCCQNTVTFARQHADLDITEKGTHDLKGIDEPVPLFQVLPKSLAKRTFGGLRNKEESKLTRAGSMMGNSLASTAEYHEVQSMTSQGSSNSQSHSLRSVKYAAKPVKSTETHFLETLFSVAGEKDRKQLLGKLCDMWRIPFKDNKQDRALRLLADRLSSVVRAKSDSSSKSPGISQRESLAGSVAQVSTEPSVGNCVASVGSATTNDRGTSILPFVLGSPKGAMKVKKESLPSPPQHFS